MPDTNDGPAVVEPVTTDAPTKENPLPGFAEAMAYGRPSRSAGEPEAAPAVETSKTVEAPKTEAAKPETASAKVEEKPAAAPAINFDGLSEPTKAFWENALKAGHATPVDVERARTESLFQSAWSKRNAAKDKEVLALKKEIDEFKPHKEVLEKVWAEEKLHTAWIEFAKKVRAGEVAPTGVDEFFNEETSRNVAKVAEQVVERREREREERTAREQKEYNAMYAEVQVAVREFAPLLGVKPDVLAGYLAEEEKALNGVDPILRYGKNPTELIDKVRERHEKASLAAENAALREQLTQRASKQVQAAKQSLPPGRRVSDEGRTTPKSKLDADLGLDPNWANVQGFGGKGR